MSDRDELARDLFFAYEHAQIWQAEERAKHLWAAGWRKKPSRDAIRRAVLEGIEGAYTDISWAAVRTNPLPKVDRATDAILALLDGQPETVTEGESE